MVKARVKPEAEGGKEYASGCVIWNHLVRDGNLRARVQWDSDLE